MIDHDVMWFDVSVNDALRVAEVETLQNFIDVVFDVKVSERSVQFPKVLVASVHILHDQCGCFGRRISHHVEQTDYVDTSSQGFQNFDLSSDLGLLDRFENFDDHSVIVFSVDSLIYFRVLSTSQFLDDLVSFL